MDNLIHNLSNLNSILWAIYRRLPLLIKALFFWVAMAIGASMGIVWLLNFCHEKGWI